MNDAVHVEIEVIVFDVVRVLLARIDGDLNAVDYDRFLFDRVHNHHRILLRQPSVERWNSHRSLRFNSPKPKTKISLIQFSLKFLNGEE